MHVHVHMHVHVYTYVVKIHFSCTMYTYIRTHTYTHTRTYVRTYIIMYTSINLFVHTHARMYVHTCVWYLLHVSYVQCNVCAAWCDTDAAGCQEAGGNAETPAEPGRPHRSPGPGPDQPTGAVHTCSIHTVAYAGVYAYVHIVVKLIIAYYYVV